MERTAATLLLLFLALLPSVALAKPLGATTTPQEQAMLHWLDGLFARIPKISLSAPSSTPAAGPFASFTLDLLTRDVPLFAQVRAAADRANAWCSRTLGIGLYRSAEIVAGYAIVAVRLVSNIALSLLGTFPKAGPPGGK